MNPMSLALLFALSFLALHTDSTRHDRDGHQLRPFRPPSSYAILGRDPLTGEYGVAAASHAPLIGMNIEFLDPDAGAVVVLGGPYLQLNETVLIALRDGLAPDRAVAVGLAGDVDRESRQVLALAPTGAAAFSGEKLAKNVDHSTGEHFVAAGHRLASDAVVQAMAEAFRDAGGETDGEHSAAVLVVGPGARYATRGRLLDLRIDFVPGNAVTNLVELRARVDSVYEVLK
jgi:uncharacterized Ntn-hydrolase superfamily protein